MQSFFIGFGAVLAALMPWFLLNIVGMDKISGDGSIPNYVKVSFLVGGISFLGAMYGQFSQLKSILQSFMMIMIKRNQLVI